MTPLAKAAGTAAARTCAGASLPRALPTAGVGSAQTAQFSGESSGDDDHHFGVWPPNQTTVLFQRMEETCPDVLTAYARCVIDKQNGGALMKGACEEQFQAVMDCFRSARY